MKRLAIWNYHPAEVLAFGLTSGAVPSPYTDIVRWEPLQCFRGLQQGAVSTALIPTLQVLRSPDAFDVAPHVGIVTSAYPYVRLFLRKGLEAIEKVAFDPRYAQEILVTRIVLREHYQVMPAFIPKEQVALELLDTYDAVLLVGPEVPMISSSYLALDIGQEWFELTAYPMVWGLVAAQKGTMTVEEALALKASAAFGAENIDLWLQAAEPPEPIRQFLQEHFSPLLEGPALGGLDELAEYFFFYGVLDEIPDIPFLDLPEEEDEGETPTENK